MNSRSIFLIVFTLLFSALHAEADAKGRLSGEKEFEKHCASCHPDGANTINQNKPLKKESLKKNGITNWQGIVAVMRQPGPGMIKFDQQTIPDKEARAIAEYVLKTFK
ncbi:c-type cytochrome [Pelotalea chapellei]|uniref:C-type cytochrome n=1 Tax=Pelotalea chapellei TaxID=44671 RepID=A0ABS5U9U4_9BACT|nr:c-type cytochrome [Pelotalea chapellei]MBT1072439.1 c-type cytochrome [Pelotalea chapellei]